MNRRLKRFFAVILCCALAILPAFSNAMVADGAGGSGDMQPTPGPTPGITEEPTEEPTDEPTDEPDDPTDEPDVPTDDPTGEPTEEPNLLPDGTPMPIGVPFELNGGLVCIPDESDLQPMGTAEDFAKEVVRLVNAERAKRGLPALSGGYVQLNSASAVRARELVDLFSHARPDGTACYTAMTEAGVKYTFAGENIAAGFPTPARVMAAWMDSPGHRSSILSEDYNYIGVGYYAGGSRKYNWVQMFSYTYPDLSVQPVVVEAGDAAEVKWIANPPHDNLNLSFAIANEAMATVSQEGIVSGRAAGETEIAVSMGDIEWGSEYSSYATAPVTVIPYVAAEAIALPEPTLELSKTEAHELELEFTPSDASRKVSWESSAPTIVAVDARGHLTAKAVGTATITATAKSGVTTACAVTVVQRATKVVPVPLALTLASGATQRLTAQVLPVDHTEAGVSWESSAPGVVSVEADGTLTARALGEAMITASVPSGKTGTCTVRVVIPATCVTLGSTELRLEAGSTQALTATLEPADSSEAVTYTSSNTRAATVDAQGVVKALAPGKVTITAKAGSAPPAVCAVTVWTNPTGIALAAAPATLVKGKTLKIAATVRPAGTGAVLTWASSDEAVATVDQTGKVTALSAGTTVVSLTAPGGLKGERSLTVLSPATSVSLAQTTLALKSSQSSVLTALLQPSDSTDTVAWSSGSKSVASVDAQGNVTGNKPGKAIITCKTKSGKKAACTVFVYEDAESVAIATSATSLNVGKSLTLACRLAPAKAFTPIEFSSSDNGIATVDPATGVVRGLRAGSVEITATTLNGKTATKTLRIDAPATKVVLSATRLALLPGGTAPLAATLEPSDCTDSSKWSTSNRAVATVDENGVVTAVKLGKATITCKAKSGKYAICTVWVYGNAESVSITTRATSLNVGKTLALSAKSLPANAYAPITFSSSDEAIATVDAVSGVVRAVSRGTVTITAATPNGKTAAKALTVLTPVTLVTLDKSALLLEAGKTAQLTAVSEPGDATDTYRWSSSSRAVATVDENGLVTGAKLGTTLITVKAQSGKKATCKVTVWSNPASLTLSAAKTRIAVGSSLTLSAKQNPSASRAPLSWESSAPAIADVSPNGVITCATPGVFTITATTPGGAKGTVTLTSVLPATAVLLNQTVLTLSVGAVYTLNHRLLPAESNDTFTFSSSNVSTVAVSATGVLTAKRAGTVKITIKTGSGKVAVCTVTVVQ